MVFNIEAYWLKITVLIKVNIASWEARIFSLSFRFFVKSFFWFWEFDSPRAGCLLPFLFEGILFSGTRQWEAVAFQIAPKFSIFRSHFNAGRFFCCRVLIAYFSEHLVFLEPLWYRLPEQKFTNRHDTQGNLLLDLVGAHFTRGGVDSALGGGAGASLVIGQAGEAENVLATR